MINLVAPITQRAIVSPQRLNYHPEDIANAISIVNPEVRQIMSLIGERPEEVTDMDRPWKRK